MDYKPYRRQMLQHCLKLARMDYVYARSAADWYEANEPWALTGLRAKLDELWERSASTAPAVLSPGQREV